MFHKKITALFLKHYRTQHCIICHINISECKALNSRRPSPDITLSQAGSLQAISLPCGPQWTPLPPGHTHAMSYHNISIEALQPPWCYPSIPCHTKPLLLQWWLLVALIESLSARTAFQGPQRETRTMSSIYKWGLDVSHKNDISRHLEVKPQNGVLMIVISHKGTTSVKLSWLSPIAQLQMADINRPVRIYQDT